MAQVFFFLMIGQYQRILSVRFDTGQIVEELAMEAHEIAYERLGKSVLHNRPVLCWQEITGWWNCVPWEDVIYEALEVVGAGRDSHYLLVGDTINLWRHLPHRTIIKK